ncbi:M1 family metallopeptidase [Colwellia hornerae]|nr:M1 family metallopeptidase [Colwellia hornerae]
MNKSNYNSDSFLSTLFFSVLLFSTNAISVSTENFKLSNDIVPLSQIVELKLNPELDGYSGTTTIEINITKATQNIKLYSKNLLISSAIIKNKNNKNKTTLLTVGSTSQYDIISLPTKNTLPKGIYQLSLSFDGKYSDTGNGLFKVTEKNNNYLFTQFQAMLARSVFPSFDQPNFKIPFQLKVNVPKGYLVVSNTPQIQLISHNDWHTFVFEPTAPIYTDVLAFSVGKFDSVDIPEMKIPSKLYVVKGKLPQTTYAIKHIGKIFKEVESFFTIEYPYKKLDMVAVPNYSNAAMEHVGLIYFKEDFILLDDTPSIRQQKYSLKLIAHEIAHMWFGNLVTMQWWNDLWLNESFAEWLAHKVVIQIFPELSAELDLPQIRSLSDDNVNNQLPVRRTVKSKADVDSLGGLVYGKGNAILNMVEHYVGEDIFRQAVISYVLEYRNKNASLQDFVKHIEITSKKDLEGFFSSFLEQAGFPLLSLQRNNDKLLISQSPFKTNNQVLTQRIEQKNHNKNKKPQDMSWQVPLMIKFLTDDNIITRSVFLNKESIELTIPKGVKAIFPDANAVGYYRYILPDEDEKFIKNNITRLNDAEKLAWLNNNEHLTKIAKRAYADVLSVKLALLSDLSLNKKIATDIIRDIDYSYTDFIPEAISEEYSRYITRHLSVIFKTVKWNSSKKETIADKALKASLLALAGGRLADKGAIKFAKANYQDVLSEQSSLDSSMSNAVLKVVAANSNEDVYQLFELAYLRTTNSNLKSDILTSMGYFTSLDIVTRYYNFLVSGKVPTDEIGYRFQYPSFNPALRHHVIDYIAVNKDKILKHINQKQWFPYNFYTSCEEDIRIKVNQTFSTWIKDIPGLKEKLNTVDETIKQCIRSRTKNISQLQEQLLK